MRCGSVNSPETLGMTETLIASVRFHQWPTFLLMSGPHFLTHHQASLKEESWRWKEKVIWMKSEVWELRVYFWWSGGETTFFSVLLCLLFVLMPARTCQSWYKMYVLQQTHKHIRQKMRPRYPSFCCVCFSPKCLDCKYWQKSQQSWYGKTVTAFTSSWFHVNSYGVLTIPFWKLCTQLHTIYILQPGHKQVERAQTENFLRR